jgi:membrane protein DedA with SNARE-associated domain
VDQLKVFLELLIQVVVPVPGETVILMAEVAAPES